VKSVMKTRFEIDTTLIESRSQIRYVFGNSGLTNETLLPVSKREQIARLAIECLT
jgi:hypothetical protein